MKEHYVSYNQAVKLKELGFAEKVNRGYSQKMRIEPDVSFSFVKEVYSKDPKNYNDHRKGVDKGVEFWSAPRLDQAQAWLRDCKDVIVIAEPDWKTEIEDDSDYLTGKWCFVVWKDGCRILCNFDPNKEDEELWLLDTYESALSAGIDKALELLGKEVNNE